MAKIRLGIIGCGNIGSQHFSNVLNGKCPEVSVTAIADINPDRLEWAKKTWSSYCDKNADLPEVALFSNSNDLMTSGMVDAVIISTVSISVFS